MLFLLGILIGSGFGFIIACLCIAGSENHRKVPVPGRVKYTDEAAQLTENVSGIVSFREPQIVKY